MSPFAASGAGRPPADRSGARTAARFHSFLVVLAGYLLIFTVEAYRVAALAENDLPPTGLAETSAIPAELTLDEEHALWASLTSLSALPELEVTITSLRRDLVASRAFRLARRGGDPTRIPEAVQIALERLAQAEVASFEVHVAVRGGRDLDPLAVARSVRLAVAGIQVLPLAPPQPGDLRLVREALPGQAPRLRSLRFVVSFPRASLRGAPGVTLALALGPSEVEVFLSSAQLSG